MLITENQIRQIIVEEISAKSEVNRRIKKFKDSCSTLINQSVMRDDNKIAKIRTGVKVDGIMEDFSEDWSEEEWDAYPEISAACQWVHAELNDADIPL